MSTFCLYINGNLQPGEVTQLFQTLSSEINKLEATLKERDAERERNLLSIREGNDIISKQRHELISIKTSVKRALKAMSSTNAAVDLLAKALGD